MSGKKINVNFIIGLLIIVLSGALIFLLLYKRNDTEYRFELENTSLRNYEVNEVIPVYVTESDIAKKYLTEFVTLMLMNREEAYSLLSAESLNRFSTLKSFEDYVASITTEDFLKIQVQKYSYDKENQKRVIYVVDADNNTFKFIENSLMDYRVSILN